MQLNTLKDKKDEFDIILIDSTDPMGPGEGLFTDEFYTNVKNSLKKGGIMVAQSESPFAQAESVRKMYVQLKSIPECCYLHFKYPYLSGRILGMGILFS